MNQWEEKVTKEVVKSQMPQVQENNRNMFTI
jgi:hypothetical protein